MSLFVCPICGAALEREPGRYRCPAGHSYDVAREGYTHLLPANRKHSKMPGDDKGIPPPAVSFSARTTTPPADARAVWHWTMPGASGGAGHRRARILHQRRLPAPGRRKALHGGDGHLQGHPPRAAKREKDVEFAVASSYHLPVADRSIDLLLNCFSPLALEEFRRALRPGGTFLYVVPSEKHLWELKQVLYDHPYPNEVKETPYEGFAYAEIRHVEDRIRVLGQEDIHALFQMTPYYWKTPKSGCQRLAALEELAVTISFDIHVFRREA
ncbi:MAG: putative RNA methyltransferase [Oscillospiraceae bacterium]